MGNQVGNIQAGGSFGELALMYNAPRAATVVSAESGCTVWALDRVTFRKILMTSASERRKMYEGFLGEVPLLDGLKPRNFNKYCWYKTILWSFSLKNDMKKRSDILIS